MSNPHPTGADSRPTSAPAMEADLDLGAYIAALRRRWWWLALGAALGGVAAFGVVRLRPVIYEATSTLLISQQQRGAGMVPDTQTFRAMLENGSLASEVIGDLKLAEAPHRLTPQRFLAEALSVETPAGSSIVRVRVRLQDAKMAAEASRRLSEKAITLTRRLRQDEGSSLQDQLKTHLDKATERLQATESEVLTFRQQAQLEILKEDTDAMLEERGDLLKLLIDIESEKARLAAAEREIATQKPVLIVPRAVGAERALRNAGQDEAEAHAPPTDTQKSGQRPADRFAPADPESVDVTNPFINPVYQTLEFQIATSRSRLAALEQQRRQVVDVRRLGGDGFGRLSELYRREIELARLQTNHDLAKRVHSDLTVRYEESRTQAVGNSTQLQLVDAAIPPDRPMSRRTVQFMALGLAAGVVAAGILALAVRTGAGPPTP